MKEEEEEEEGEEQRRTGAWDGPWKGCPSPDRNVTGAWRCLCSPPNARLQFGSLLIKEETPPPPPPPPPPDAPMRVHQASQRPYELQRFWA